jgi:hypothetical protein
LIILCYFFSNVESICHALSLVYPFTHGFYQGLADVLPERRAFFCVEERSTNLSPSLPATSSWRDHLRQYVIRAGDEYAARTGIRMICRETTLPGKHKVRLTLTRQNG